MDFWIQTVLTLICSLLASGGLWTYLQSRHDKHDAKTDLLVGLAHDIIISKGLTYIDRGWITQDEFENLNDYIFKPYEKAGGNGTAKKVMDEVRRLPIKASRV